MYAGIDTYDFIPWKTVEMVNGLLPTVAPQNRVDKSPQ